MAPVQRTLNRPAVDDALIKTGLNQAALAEQLKVSREAVSKWFSGKSFPKPDKLLRIGLLLGLEFDQLVQAAPGGLAPVVFFRKKTNRVTTRLHLDEAQEKGELLRRLVPHLAPQVALTRPPTLKDPSNDYTYVQAVAAELRREMGLEQKPVIEFGNLIGKFNDLHAILIPVLWGDTRHHGNALSVHLPDTQTTWVYLNLDSNILDFKFWMAHELGHSLAPDFVDEAGECFADHFAQAFLFPEASAARLRDRLGKIAQVEGRVRAVLGEATRHMIAPYTIRKALEGYEKAKGLPSVALGAMPGFMAATGRFTRKQPTLSRVLFRKNKPPTKDYIGCCQTRFGSPFFEVLRAYGAGSEGLDHYIHRVLDLSMADAKELAGALGA